LKYFGCFSTYIVEDVLYFLSPLSHLCGILCGILDRPPLCIFYQRCHILLDYSAGYLTYHVFYLVIMTITSMWTTLLGDVRIFPFTSVLMTAASIMDYFARSWTNPLSFACVSSWLVLLPLLQRLNLLSPFILREPWHNYIPHSLVTHTFKFEYTSITLSCAESWSQGRSLSIWQLGHHNRWEFYNKSCEF